MKRRLTQHELILVAGVVAMGCFLRFAQLDQLALEHFDEGVYSSGVWYWQISDQPYPASHLYAPPALPVLIRISTAIAGPKLGPFLPGLFMGALSILALWGFVRALFGQAAGLVACPLIALSDFHIIYSRMALTDVPVLLGVLLSVWLAVTAIDRQSYRRMMLAGAVCGLAWWIKYSGWLPIAIVGSGSAFWWIIAGRKTVSFGRLLGLNMSMASIAVVVWSPWYFDLNQHGGYSAVAANHAAYLQSWGNWQKNLSTQVTWYSMFDSWLSAVAIVMGLVFAGCQRWLDACRSTWNQTAHPRRDTPGLLRRYLAAAVLLGIAALTIGSFATLAAVGVSGIAGLLLWPTLSMLRNDSDMAMKKPKSESAKLYDESDFHAAPENEPLLGACIVTAWFLGMLLMTPRYTPFPRLLLPLLAVIWIASAAGIGWWIESSLNVVRRGLLKEDRMSHRRHLASQLSVVILALAVWKFAGTVLGAPVVHQSRAGLKGATRQIAELCQESAAADGASDGETPFVVYVFGEPSVLFHLNQAGIVAAPVGDVNFLKSTDRSGRTVPTFFVFGPNALRTPGFSYDWPNRMHRFHHLEDVEWNPSDVVLYNLYPPTWLATHRQQKERMQLLELYRLK